MSLPYSKFVPISAKVQSPAFTVEKQHALLATTNSLIGTDTPFIEFSGASALTNFKAVLGGGTADYTFASKYFSFASKTGATPDKLVVARWYKTATAPFIKGAQVTATVAELKEITSGSFKLKFGGTTAEVEVNMASAASYSEIATLLQTAIQSLTSSGTAFTGATVTYSTITKGFIITSGDTGAEASVSAVTAGETGTDISAMLGLTTAELSQGADAETFAEFCDRILNANSSGFSITTTETLSDTDIVPAVAWLQGSLGDQTIATVCRLVFDITDKATAKALQATIKELGYTGYVVIYDPQNEQVNALDCAICAAVDHQSVNGAINFNFQPATGYTPITTVGDVVNYQAGQTNLSLAEELDELCISYVYSVGAGTQQVVLYGMGLMMGAYGTEDVQCNEAALERDLQVAVMNGFIAVNKYKLQGTDAQEAVSGLITPAFERAKSNGAIAINGTLSESDKIAVYNATGNEDAVDAVEQNGYYFQIQDLTAEDISLRRVRILVCYLSGGVINVLRINNNIFGA